ncbi:MAG: hypothetical protein KatS3mg057_1678 [Herpetosiphonaceae bacterium]|nr:MAG: hypothetical protein KatS3mg057_1678 [Herpetosiphonaceae bacterium]
MDAEEPVAVEIETGVLLETLDLCRRRLTAAEQALYAEKLAQLEALVRLLDGEVQDQAILEQVLLRAPAETFDAVAHHRLLLWTYGHVRGPFSARNKRIAEEVAAELATEEAGEKLTVDDRTEDLPDVDSEEGRQAFLRDWVDDGLMLLLFSPVQKTVEYHLTQAKNNIKRHYRAVVEALPVSVTNDVIEAAREHLEWLVEHEVSEPERINLLDLPILSLEDIVPWMEWLRTPATKDWFESAVDDYRELVNDFWSLLEALPAEVDGPAITAARQYADTLCLACGHHRPLTSHMAMCSACAWCYPIGIPETFRHYAAARKRGVFPALLERDDRQPPEAHV